MFERMKPFLNLAQPVLFAAMFIAGFFVGFSFSIPTVILHLLVSVLFCASIAAERMNKEMLQGIEGELEALSLTALEMEIDAGIARLAHHGKNHLTN